MTLRFERRLDSPRWLSMLSPVIAIALAFAVGAVLLWIAGLEPWQVYGHIVDAGFLSAFALSDTMVKTTPIMLCALGVGLAFRAKQWNIGAEGQLFMGAWAASGVALHGLPPSTPRVVMWLSMALAAMIAGGLWAGMCGWLKAKMRVSEIITTLMLTYVAHQWMSFFVFGPWSERGFQLTPQFPANAWLPRLSDASQVWPSVSGMTAHPGILLGIAAAAILSYALSRSRWGYEIRVMGDGYRAAQCAGMPVERNIAWVMVASGALAGLAGMVEVAGVVHRLQDRFSPGYGFTAIIVAWLAGLRPWSIVLVSFVFGGLLVGGKQVQPAGIPQMLQGLILLVIVGSEMALRYRVRLSQSVRQP